MFITMIGEKGRIDGYLSFGIGQLERTRNLSQRFYNYRYLAPFREKRENAVELCSLLGQRVYDRLCSASDVFGKDLPPWRLSLPEKKRIEEENFQRIFP